MTNYEQKFVRNAACISNVERTIIGSWQVSFGHSALPTENKMKGCDFSMGIYTEKRAQLIEKIKGLEKRIASDTAKKKTLKDELKEVSRLAMAEEYNCKRPCKVCPMTS